MTIQKSEESNESNIRMQIYLTQSQRDWLRHKAYLEDSKMSVIIRDLIDKASQSSEPKLDDNLSLANLSVCAHDWAVAQLTLELNTRAYNSAIGGYKVQTTQRFDPSDIIVLNAQGQTCLHIEVKTECRKAQWGFTKNLRRNIKHVENYISRGDLSCPVLLVQCHILKRDDEESKDLLRMITDAAPDYSLINERAKKWSAVLWSSPDQKYWLIGETLTEITKIMHNGVDQFIESAQQLWQDCT